MLKVRDVQNDLPGGLHQRESEDEFFDPDYALLQRMRALCRGMPDRGDQMKQEEK